MAILPKWVRSMLRGRFGLGRRDGETRARSIPVAGEENLGPEELAFKEKWGFVSHRFQIQKRLVADIEKSARDLETPHYADPAYSMHKIPNIRAEVLQEQMKERIETAGYAPLRRPILDGDDFPDLFVPADGLQHMTANNVPNTIPARNQSHDVRDERIEHLGTYVFGQDGIFALIDRKGAMYVTSLTLIYGSHSQDSFRELLLRAGMVETDAWKPPLTRRSVITALTSGLDDQDPTKPDYETHVKYHRALALPVLGRPEFETLARAIEKRAALPPPSPRGGTAPS